MLVGPITKVFGTHETFIRQRPVPQTVGFGAHYARGRPEDPMGEVTNEDYAGALVVFAGGARGTFECSRSMIGPESQMAFDVYGTRGAVGWNLEKLNELQVCLVDEDGRAPRGYTTVYGGDRYPYHGHFVPGDANSIGFEDVITIEDYAFLDSVAKGEQHQPGTGGGARLRQLPGRVAALVLVRRGGRTSSGSSEEASEENEEMVR